MSSLKTPILAWHFVSANRALRDGSPLPPIGHTLRHDGPLIPCESGLHASARALDALRYAPGPILCRVRCGGDVAYHGDPVDKLACRERSILAVVDASTTLHDFACWCAERALAGISNPDPRSVAAVETKRRWLRGEATDAELSAARSAARSAAESAAESAAWSAAESAARSAAWSAAESAARSAAWAAAESAAWSAAESAAWPAAWSAAESAAWPAAWSAAESAAWSAAESAARSAQAAELEARALALIAPVE